MHEIVTLQFGQQANYVGTHFWNAQESYFTYGQDEESPVDHDIHFRPGVGSDGSETYTPRTVIYDLKGAFGTLRRDNALYQLQSQDEAGQEGQWPGQAQVLQQPTIPPSEYQQHLNEGLEPPPLTTSSVRYWSDYNHVFYHPRSIVQLHEFELNSSLAPFERWPTGEELFSNLDKEHDLLDKDLRPFLEECDQLQGVQLFTSTDDAWGGFASSYLERIRDELGKTSLWAWGMEDGTRKPRDRQLLQTTNSILSLSSLAESASLYIPLTTLPHHLPSYISPYNPTSKWDTSALQLTALESLTLPTRLRPDQPSRATLSDFESTLSNSGKRRLAHLSLSASPPNSTANGATNGHGPDHDARTRDGVNGGPHAEDTAEDEAGLMTLDVDFAPAPPSLEGRAPPRSGGGGGGQTFAQIQSLRGTFKSSLEIEDVNLASRDKYSAAASEGVRVSCHQSGLLFGMLGSFPRIYEGAQRGGKMEVRTALTVGGGVSAGVRGLERVGRRVLGVEDREAVCERLLGVAEEYEEGWSGGESEDDE